MTMPEPQIAVEATAQLLEEKIRARTARVGIVGLGYVGLPLAVEFAKAGFTVTGIDVSESKIRSVNRGDSYVQDIAASTLGPLVEAGKLRATTDFSAVRDLDTINICVPTPLRKTKDPDMSYIVSACEEIAKYFHPGMLVILESTTYPGTTDEVVLPMLERSRASRWARISSCASRPSASIRAIPNTRPTNIPKVVGGITAGLHRDGRAVLLAGARDGGAGQLHASGGDGEAAREHVPHDQHRPGQRNRADVRPHGHQRLGSDRRGRHQAVRLHAVLSRPRPGRALHPHRSVLSFLEDQAGRHRSAVHRAGRLHQRPDAALRGGQGAERAERRRQAGEGLAHPRHGRGLQARYRRCAGIAGARHHSCCCSAAARR